MPEAYFRVEWPDGEVTRCYSPSTVVLEYFQEGLQLTVGELSSRSVEALEHASRRVEAKFGYRCSSAAAQRDQILEIARRFRDKDKTRILSVEIAE